MSNETRLKEEKELIKLEKKYRKEYGEDWVAELRGMQVGQLERKLLGFVEFEQEQITLRNRDPKLIDAKDLASGLERPYRTHISASKEKQRFVSLLMKEKKLDS